MTLLLTRSLLALAATCGLGLAALSLLLLPVSPGLRILGSGLLLCSIVITALQRLPPEIALAQLVLISLAVVALRLAVWPGTDRNWTAEHSVLPSAASNEGSLTIEGFRTFRHSVGRPSEPSWESRTLDPSRIHSVDFIVVPFQGTPGGAHTFLSFGLDSGEHIAISVEARREESEAYSTLTGLFRRYELIYVIGDERDLILQRTERDGDRVFLYPGRAEPEIARDLFLSMLERANQLRVQPEHYDTLANNCTTNLVDHLEDVTPVRIGFDVRLLLPALSDGLALDLGLLDTELVLDDARSRFRVDDRAHRQRNSDDFSRLIRQAADTG